MPAGAAAFCEPGGPAKPKQERGPRAPAPALCALCAPAAPPETLEFLASHTIHPPTFSAPKPAHKTSGPLPMSGPPAYSVGNQHKFSSWFSPAFFKSGPGGRAERRQWRKKRGGSPVSKGVEGSRFSGDAQRPLRTARGAAPPTGSRGRAPGGAWGSPPRNTLRYKLRYRSMYWRALFSQVKWARIPRVMRLRQEAG